MMDEIELREVQADIAELARELDAAREALRSLRQWLDGNMTFYDIDAGCNVEGRNVPTLARVSKRIWYHATDDITAYPFLAVADSALAVGQAIASTSPPKHCRIPNKATCAELRPGCIGFTNGCHCAWCMGAVPAEPPRTAAEALARGWVYEDTLPEDMDYDAWYEQSAVVEGVRMGPA